LALILAHRGASGDSPENTLASFREAIRQRADGIELDLQLTSDGRFVAVHDRSLRRVSGHSVVVEDTAFHALRHLAAIPSLEEIFGEVPSSVPLYLDLKCRRAGRRRYAETLVAAIGERENLVFSSFNWPLLAEIVRSLPSRRVMPAVHRRFAAALRVARLLRASAIAAHHRFLRTGFVRAAAARELPVLAFTVNDAGEARRLLRMGVAGFYTNSPERLRRQLETP
jgi:glycerophosphoryl diester phosphodiesterase